MEKPTDNLKVLPATTEPYDVLYQDDVLLVVNKPARLLTVPGRHPDNADCLISRVQREFPTASVVHRLDYDTSGIVVLPLTRRVLSDISKQFQARTIAKHYVALVAGIVSPVRGKINLPIAADNDNRPLYKICEQTGKPSLTEYYRLAVDNQTKQSRLQLTPVTGRSHQLRLHMLSAGYPILGDTLYAPAEISALTPRLMLHAWQISLIHPLSGQTLDISAEPDF